MQPEFCPGIYEFAAVLLGKSPWEVSRSSEWLAAAHHAAWQRYRHRLVVVGIDVYNIEPEALGATVAQPSGKGVPAIVSHPFEELEDLLELSPFDPQAGRIPLVLEAARTLAGSCEGSEVRVPICGPMALANGLLGLENVLMGVAEDPDLAAQALRGLVSHQRAFLRHICDAGARPIFFESGSTPPLLSPSMFRNLEGPLLAELFEEAEAIFGERPPCIIGGDAAPVASDFFAAGPGYVIAPSETDQAALLNAAAGYPDIHVRVNMAATSLASGDRGEIEAEASRAKRLAASRGNTSVGCGVVPYETDPDLLAWLKEWVETQEA